MDIAHRYARRIAASMDRIEAAYAHRDDGVVPFLAFDVNYWLSVESPARIPDDYFTDCGSMLRYQTEKISRHLESCDDDYVPMLFPWYGTGVIPSALGAAVRFQSKMDPAIEGPVISRPEQVGRLSLPDPRKDGLMPRVLETIRYFREHSDLPISITDPQGPLTTALTLVGPTTLFVWFYEQPAAVHALLEFCTEVFIRWVKAQKEEIGAERARHCYPLGIALPERFGGVWLCDDDCVAISAEQYRQFVMPHNARVFREFGGGVLHFCGSAEHQIENFARTEGLVGVNSCCMGNFRQIYRMQEAFAGRIALHVCDYTPLDVESHYAELFANLRRRGTIVASFVSPEMALDRGKYQLVSRDGGELTRQVCACLRRHCG
jgi:hypothetical protein